jgi:tetratricopeptide (TPR) repeat protein
MHQRGRLGEAEAIYRRILARHPRNPDALHLLGLVAQQSGDAATALARIDEAISIDDRVAEYHHNRAVVLLRLQRAGDAESSFRRALALKAAYPDAHNGLGNALQALGRFSEAVAAYYAALQQNAEFAEAHNNLGNALRRLNKLEEAITHFQKALVLRPDYVEALCNLAATLQEEGDLAGAEERYREAISLRPDHAPAWRGLAAVQRELAVFEMAIESYRRATTTDPTNLSYRLDLADALGDFGRTDEARVCFGEIIERWPHSTDAWVGLARLARNAGDGTTAREHLATALEIDPDCIDALSILLELDEENQNDDLLRRVDRLLLDEGRPPRHRSQLCFSLAHRGHRAAAYDEAFRNYQRANELRKAELEQAGRRFDVGAHALYVDRQIRAFTAGFFRRSTGIGHPSQLPVYIIGMPRSGTTLCEQILASHSQVRALGEQLDIQTMARELPKRLAAAGISASTYPECVPDLPREVAEPLVERYLGRLRGLAPSATRVTDKHPTNFRHLGLIAALMPAARIIYCRRDPMDTCLSCFMQNFEAPIPWAWDLTSLGGYYRQYDRLMRHWLTVLPMQIFPFVYEEAVLDLEGVARRLLAFCDLPWEERCLAFHRTERPILTASRWQVRQPIYDSSVGKWRHYEQYLGPLRSALGDSIGGAGANSSSTSYVRTSSPAPAAGGADTL